MRKSGALSFGLFLTLFGALGGLLISRFAEPIWLEPVLRLIFTIAVVVLVVWRTTFQVGRLTVVSLLISSTISENLVRQFLTSGIGSPILKGVFVVQVGTVLLSLGYLASYDFRLRGVEVLSGASPCDEVVGGGQGGGKEPWTRR